MKLPAYITKMLSRLEAHGFQAFVVGGCVRDYLLGISPEDWDICTSAKPEEVLQVFQDVTVIPTGIQHGTVTVLEKDGHAEITTFRTDGTYQDNRHPQSVTFVPDIRQDLARRDFTVNAIAYAPCCGLIDPYGGQDDLKQKILRCVREPNLRLKEDALRILRALRFSAVHDLKIEPKTSAAMIENRSGLLQIARERILSELTKILSAKKPGRVLKDYPEILSVIFQADIFSSLPQGDWQKLMQYLDLLPPDSAMRFACLLYPLKDKPELYTRIINELKPDHATKNQIFTYLSLCRNPLPKSLAETRHFVGTVGMEFAEAFLIFLEGQVGLQEDGQAKVLQESVIQIMEFLSQIKRQNLCCRIAELAIDGKDLQAAGVLPGKQIGELLKQALDSVIDEKIPNEKKAILKHLFL